jgi:hypothetical protein
VYGGGGTSACAPQAVGGGIGDDALRRSWTVVTRPTTDVPSPTTDVVNPTKAIEEPLEESVPVDASGGDEPSCGPDVGTPVVDAGAPDVSSSPSSAT